MSQPDKYLSKALELTQANFTLTISTECPEHQLQPVLDLLSEVTLVLNNLEARQTGIEFDRKNSESVLRRGMASLNVGTKLTELQLNDGIRSDPRHNALLKEEATYTAAIDNLKNLMALLASYRESIFRLISLKTAETRNIK